MVKEKRAKSSIKTHFVNTYCNDAIHSFVTIVHTVGITILVHTNVEDSGYQ